jgi:hypothetical protein
MLEPWIIEEIRRREEDQRRRRQEPLVYELPMTHDVGHDREHDTRHERWQEDWSHPDGGSGRKPAAEEQPESPRGVLIIDML